METIELDAGQRTGRGKGAARTARREGKVPAVLYGPNRTPVSVVVDAKQFLTRVATIEGSHLLRLRSDDRELADRLALVKDVQRDPVTASLVHIDFYEVDVNTKIRVQVPLHFVGRSVGVELGGILQPILREVEVLCLPTDIPSFLEVDVAPLGLHDSVRLSQIPTPAGVEIHFDTDDTIVTVLPPVVEEVKVTEEAGAAVETAAKVEGA